MPDQCAAGQVDLGAAGICCFIYRTVSGHHGIVICHDHAAAYVQYSLVPIGAETILLRIHISALHGEAGANHLPIRSLLGKHIDSVAFCGDNRTALQHQITAVLHLNCIAARCALNLAGSIGHGFIVRADHGALSRRLAVPDRKIALHNKRPAIRLSRQIVTIQIQNERFTSRYPNVLRGIPVQCHDLSFTLSGINRRLEGGIVPAAGLCNAVALVQLTHDEGAVGAFGDLRSLHHILAHIAGEGAASNL